MNTELIKISKKVYYKEITDSTNTDAMNSKNAPEGSVFLAEKQNAGKGSRGRSWLSEYGGGIWMSILLYPDIPMRDIPKITLAAGLAVCRVIKDIGFDAGIKWPNDVVIGGKKVCGILAEKKQNRVAVGIGVNVNIKSFGSELENKATSLYIEGKKEFCREKIIELIAENFEDTYQKLKENGFAPLREEYKSNCITIGKKIKVIQPKEEYEAFAKDITSEGELLIIHGEEEEKLCSGEVSVRGVYGYA